jgi:hypothetical protein
VSLELDHVMVFVPDPDAIEPGWFPGCRFEPGQRHTGQGTRNRRVVFPRTFIELVWIDDGEAHERLEPVRAENPVTSCDLQILVYETAEAISS